MQPEGKREGGDFNGHLGNKNHHSVSFPLLCARIGKERKRRMLKVPGEGISMLITPNRPR